MDFFYCDRGTHLGWDAAQVFPFIQTPSNYSSGFNFTSKSIRVLRFIQFEFFIKVQRKRNGTEAIIKKILKFFFGGLFPTNGF